MSRSTEVRLIKNAYDVEQWFVDSSVKEQHNMLSLPPEGA